MRQFDVVTLSDGTHALILQADLLDQFSWRVAAPLVRANEFQPTPKLHVAIRIGRTDYIAVIDKMAAIHTRTMKRVVASVADREWDIRRALDLVFVGV